MSREDNRSVNVTGLGLIGGSLALALRRAGYTVHGSDLDPARSAVAIERGIVDDADLDPDAYITFVSVPVGHLAEAVSGALATTTGWVTDVGSVKAPVAAAVPDPRFVPGHPMAGSELDGLDGADADMFLGSTWVLTPTTSTSDDAFQAVAATAARLGAEVVAVEARAHDELVALVSHVPHLLAATLMGIADERSEEHLALLRLAAGGFRDMTRIASGSPRIWLDICASNRDAIVAGLDSLLVSLAEMRAIVDTVDRTSLEERLDRARAARLNLPSSAGPAEDLVEVRVPIPDRPGSAAEVFALSADLGVNVLDFEVVHSIEGDRGIMIVVVRREHADTFKGGLLARGFRPAIGPVS